jgi:hypothetical protein
MDSEGHEVSPGTKVRRFRRALDPIDRVSEVLFGLIMVLTFTGSLSVAESGRDEVRTMLIGALGCNLAWGVIDAVLYLMGCMADRGGGLRTFHRVRATSDGAEARSLIADALPPVVASVMEPSELDSLHQRLKALPEPARGAGLRRDDWLGGLAVFLWVFLSTFPVVIPFTFMVSVQPAMRVSNGIAVGLLFLTGWAFGRCAGRNPWMMGAAMLFLGLVLVAMTIALGG